MASENGSSDANSVWQQGDELTDDQLDAVVGGTGSWQQRKMEEMEMGYHGEDEEDDSYAEAEAEDDDEDEDDSYAEAGSEASEEASEESSEEEEDHAREEWVSPRHAAEEQEYA